MARVIEEFHDQQYHCGGKVDSRHHDQTPSIQTAFAKDVRSVIEDLGNPFESTDHTSVKAVQNAQRIGQEQFQAFSTECLIERSKSIDDVIHRTLQSRDGNLEEFFRHENQASSLRWW